MRMCTLMQAGTGQTFVQSPPLPANASARAATGIRPGASGSAVRLISRHLPLRVQPVLRADQPPRFAPEAGGAVFSASSSTTRSSLRHCGAAGATAVPCGGAAAAARGATAAAMLAIALIREAVSSVKVLETVVGIRVLARRVTPKSFSEKKSLVGCTMNATTLSTWTTLTAYLMVPSAEVRVVVTLGAGVVLSAVLAVCVPPAWLAACGA